MDAFITRIEAAMKSNHEELGNKIDGLSDRLDMFETKLTELEEKNAAAENKMDDLGTQMTNNDERTTKRIDDLVKRIDDLEKKLKDLENVPVDIKKLSEDIESRTNRQLRETLVFKNIPEGPGEEESYKDTKELLATTISENVPDVSYDEALSQIKRAHRESGHRRDDNGDPIRAGKRLIFAAFHSWDLCQTVIETFREKCIADRNFQISAEQKYGPKTNKRRQLALQLRKRLKDEGTITSGFLEFPAKLMVNFPGEVIGRKKVYRMHTNFSLNEV